MVMKYTYQMKDMYLVSDMNSAGNFLYYFLFGPKKFSFWTDNRFLSIAVHWRMEFSCLRFEQSKAILLKLQLMEYLWVSWIILVTYCNPWCTSSDVFCWKDPSGLLSCTSCRSVCGRLAVWPGGSHRALGSDISGDLAVLICSGSCSLFVCHCWAKEFWMLAESRLSRFAACGLVVLPTDQRVSH